MSDWEPVKAENLVRHKLGTYYLRAKIGGKIIRKSLKTKSLRDAKSKRDTLMPQLRLQAGAIRQGEVWTREKAIAHTRAWYAIRPSYQEKPKSLEYRVFVLGILAETLPARAVHTWCADEMLAWWTSSRISGFSPTLRNNCLGTLRKLLELAIKAGVILQDPSSDLERVRVTRTHLTLPPASALARIIEEVRSQKLIHSGQSADMIEFMAYSGCRIGEVRAITWEDIGKDSILVTGGEGRTKNHDWRKVPILPDMATLLERMRTPDCTGPLFDQYSPRYALTNACQRLGLPHMRVHDLRHLFATQCIEAGVDIPTVARWLGHKDGGALAMRTYGHLRDEHSQRAAQLVRF